ncbi:MAG: hypothetical protein HOP11_14340 [Saprospiraceae bacterium]|nr:hypothetical protein [Saprospiraceae bacterium]
MYKVITYTGQTENTIKDLLQEYGYLLITLDSGTSFRTHFSPKFKASKIDLNLTRRFPNVKFKLVQGLEAEDIKSLYETKTKTASTPNTKTVIKKILLGNPIKGVPELMSEDLIKDLLPLVNSEWKSEQAMLFVADNYPVSHEDIRNNYLCLSREFRVYVNYLPNFYEIYNSIEV